MYEYVKSMYRSYMNIREMPVKEFKLVLLLDDYKDEVNNDERTDSGNN